MKKTIVIIIHMIFVGSLSAQDRLEIQGSTTTRDTVAIIKVNYQGIAETVGLYVHSEPTPDFGLGGVFFGGQSGLQGHSSTGTGINGISQMGHGVSGYSYSGIGISGSSKFSYGVLGASESSNGIRGTSIDAAGVVGGSSEGYGVEGGSELNYGVRAGSMFNYGVFGISAAKAGGFFQGEGSAIELGGTLSIYDTGSDDAVIRSQEDQVDGDLILVSNDNVEFHLDEDNNSTSFFRVKNGDNTDIMSLDENGNLTLAGTCSCASDVNRKENIQSVDLNKILLTVASLPVKQWQFKNDPTPHIGPMAQDFYHAFGLGADSTSIAVLDAQGVAFAAIQALKQENDQLREALLILKAEVVENRQMILTNKTRKRKEK
ncbi:MAG: tail fiber domain-containing protein [Saprospiraceae bacterium]|nr:tail fiber domain-containing protein [Saprospiraceae bacterium]